EEQTNQIGHTISVATISPLAQRLAASDGKQAIVWNLETGQKAAQIDIPGDVHRYHSLSLDAKGKLLAGTTSAGFCVWDLATGELQRVVPSQLGYTYLVAFNEDSSLLACGCDEGMFALELPSFQQRAFIRSDAQIQVAFHPHDQILAMSSASRRIRLWNLSTNRETAVLQYPGTAPLRILSFSRDGNQLAAADTQTLRVWNLAGATERLILADHKGGVPSVSF